MEHNVPFPERLELLGAKLLGVKAREAKLKGTIAITEFEEATETVSICFTIETLYDSTLLGADGIRFTDDIYGWVHVRGFTGTVPIIRLADAVEVESETDTYLNRTLKCGYSIHHGVAKIKVRNNFRKFPLDVQVFRFEFFSPNFTFFHDTPVDPEAEPFFRLEGLPSRLKGKEMKAEVSQDRFMVLVSVTRKYSYYIWNYVVVLYCIVAANVGVLALEIDDIPSRNNISFTLFLTLTAFRFVVAEGVAKAEYMTLMDIYTLIGFLFIVAALAENCMVTGLGLDENKTIKADTAFHLTYISSWTTLFLGFILVAARPQLARQTWEEVENAYRDERNQYTLSVSKVEKTGLPLGL